MSQISPTHLWKRIEPYWIIAKIAVLVLGSLAYLHFFEGFRKFSKASKALQEKDSNQSTWDKQDIIDLP